VRGLSFVLAGALALLVLAAAAPAREAAVPRVSIFDLSVDEGGGNAVFNVRLSAATDQTVTVDFAATDIVAKAGEDYQATSGALTFAPGQTAAQVTVPILDDQLDENDEVFDVVLSNPANATLGRDRGRATIVDNDPEPTLSVADASTSAVLNGAAVRFTITLSTPSGRAVSVALSTADDTATAPSDYAATTRRVAFKPGETTATVDVPVVQDTTDEPDESFLVNLSAPFDATIEDGQAVGTIPDDDPAPNVSVDDLVVKEGNAGTVAVTFAVKLSKASAKPISVDYATADGSAKAPADYRSVSGKLAFAPGAVQKTVVVRVVGDRLVEPDETFSLVLSNPMDTFLLHGAGQATIRNDDATPKPVPGKSVNLQPAGGIVVVRVPGKGVVPLDSLSSVPYGATIDATRGQVSLTAAGGKATFGAGRFVLTSEPGFVTTLTLGGGSFASCPKVRPKPKPQPKKKKNVRRPAAAAPPTVIRQLVGNGKGRFRTRGRYAAATVRGTRWRIEDRCDGTRVVVLSGRVAVFDPHLKRTIVVTAGQSHLVGP
jgi:hypothetical protein